MRTPTLSPTPCASPSRRCANAAANPGSSPRGPAPATTSTQHHTPGPKEGIVDRASGLRMRRVSLARLGPRRMLHLPSRTVRLRLTLLYSGLFLVSGVALLAVTYLIFRSNSGVDLIVPSGISHRPAVPGAGNGAPPNPEAFRQERQMYAASVARNTHGLHQGLLESAIALAIMTAVSIAFGWLVAV